MTISPSAAMQVVEHDLETYLAEVPGAMDWEFLFCVDTAITDGSFGFQLKDRQARMSGGDEIGVSHAFYTLLEELGYTFFLYNHWRTAENRTSARYAMASTLEGVIAPDDFYETYARRLAIEDRETYKKMLVRLQQADDHARTYLGNIGFCWMGAWRSGGSFPWMNREQVQTARDYYLEAGELLGELIRQVEPATPAYGYLAFMGNRVLCSVLYLDAFLEAGEIRTIRKEADGSVSAPEQLRAREICNRALLLFDQYMETHAQMMPDRGCEGLLVSVWNAPIRGLKVYRSQLGGEDPSELPHSDTPVDAPPLPIFYNEAEGEK